MRARVACVDVPALPLQLLARAHPEWADAPLAVIEADHPQARIEWVDERARRRRVRVGLRYASALQLARDLRAAPVSPAEIDSAVRELVGALHGLSPRVEAEGERPGVFWLDPSGLGSLFGPLERWSATALDAVRGLGLEASVVVGFARLPAWAIASTRRGVLVLEDAAEEARLAGAVPLATLGVPPGWAIRDRAIGDRAIGDREARTRTWAELRDAMLALGVTHLAELLTLPRGEVGVRFGPAARELHALFADALRPPMHPVAVEEPLVVEAELDPPDDDQHRLLFCIKGALHSLMVELGSRALALAALTITLELERAPARSTRLEPASPTRDALALLELARLRLGTVSLRARVERVVLRAETARLDGTQLSLFGGRRRDPDAARRGIARLRAAFGDDAVTRAHLRDAWLPEQSFSLEPTDSVEPPRQPPLAEAGTLCRRVLPAPRPLPAGRDGRPRTAPPITELVGPYRLEGGWWEQEVARDYFYGERADGAMLWLFRDRRDRRWYLQGHVE